MPWIVNNVMDQRIEFVALAKSGEFKFNHLCQRFGISRSTGYKWFERAKDKNILDALKDRSRRPASSPGKVSEEIERAIIGLRKTYPYWGARKLGVLFKEQYPKLKAPCERTINRIVHRNGLLDEYSPAGKEFKRFEYEKPNDLWQMDYKGEFFALPGQYCYPLTVLDDHSRYNVVLDAYFRIKGEDVKQSLTHAFRLNGMPERMLMDRGIVWYAMTKSKHHWTKLTVWLMRLGINVIHSSRCHPQTAGKDERFHKTLKYDLLKRKSFDSLDEIQGVFDKFRYEYNYVRPHDSLGLKRPADKYSPSPRLFPETIPPIEYPERSVLRKVSAEGDINFKGWEWPISDSLAREYVHLIQKDHLVEVYYINTHVRTLNLKEHTYE